VRSTASKPWAAQNSSTSGKVVFPFVSGALNEYAFRLILNLLVPKQEASSVAALKETGTRGKAENVNAVRKNFLLAGAAMMIEGIV
ncbi:MAG: hypothetical protein ICV53_23485, partial [Flavisolibacter sp.]|nr:hypothetical protein [Flavisolibacter sp.]